MSPRGSRPVQEPFGTVLVPTDFSQGSASALDRALSLPLVSGARLDLVHVLPDVSGKLRAKVEAAAHEALDREVARARAAVPGADVTCKLLRGQPYVEIVRRARSIEAELTVLGRHGRRPLRDLFLGTTAAHLVRVGETPTLVVVGRDPGPYHKLLVAVDLGDTTPRLAALALRIAGVRPTVTVVHATHVPFESFLASTEAARAEVRRPVQAKAAAALARILSPHEGQARWKTIVRTGDARMVVVNEATRCCADVIVLGTHGRSGLSHALFGSVAEWVLGNAPCDVLVARPTRFSFALP